jgi:cephalosporin-C deacetylase-like acetyl esterase
MLTGALVASYLTFWRAVRPPRASVPLRPADVGLEVRDITIDAEDGVALHGWLVPRRGSPSVVVLHGYPAEKAEMLPIAATLAQHFSVLLMDLRYFGRSGGSATTFGIHERGDLRRAVDVLMAQGASPVGVFGLSLGGAVAILTAAEDPRIRAVAAYAPYFLSRSPHLDETRRSASVRISGRVSGIPVTRAPKGASASSIAWARRGWTGMMPPSPAPLAPSGLSGVGDSR